MNQKIVSISMSTVFILLGFMSCSKKDQPVTEKKDATVYRTFAGQSHGMYDYEYPDSAGHVIREFWDSTYNDTIRVAINAEKDTIIFTLSSNDYKAQPYATVYGFRLNEANRYSFYRRQNTYQDFRLTSGDSLYSHFSDIAYGTTFTDRLIDFSGKRVE